VYGLRGAVVREAKHEFGVEDCRGFMINLVVDAQKAGHTFAAPPVIAVTTVSGPFDDNGIGVYIDSLLWSKEGVIVNLDADFEGEREEARC